MLPCAATSFTGGTAQGGYREQTGMETLSMSLDDYSPHYLSHGTNYAASQDWQRTREERIEPCIEGWGAGTRPVAFGVWDYPQLEAQREAGAANQWPFGDAALLHKAGLCLSKGVESAYRKTRPGQLKDPPAEVVAFPTTREAT